MPRHLNPRVSPWSLWAIALSLSFSIVACSSSGSGNSTSARGVVQSGSRALSSATVTLYSTGAGQAQQVLGSIETDANGSFDIPYDAPASDNAILYLIVQASPLVGMSAANPNPVVLATVLVQSAARSDIVINERTTIATAFAMAQFINDGSIGGTSPGLQNATATAANLADPSTGDIASVLVNLPNGLRTSTMLTFNSLANMLAACADAQANCDSLFDLATPRDGATPTETLQAAVNIAHYPSQNVDDLLAFSRIRETYRPSLGPDASIDAWSLAIRYDGNGEELDGPGAISFDADGNAWIVNNYVFQLDPFDPDGRVCGGEHLLRFTPAGEDFPGAPYKGGGVYGAGFGVTLDPDGNVWVGNFGFQGTNCTNSVEELSQTVSKFAPSGKPISPNSKGNDIGQDHGGFQGAGNTIAQPQGTVSDRDGNIWIANCSGDSVTKFPGGNPDAAVSFAPVDDADEPLLSKPFDVAIDSSGNAFVTSNANHSIIGFDPTGELIYELSGNAADRAGIVHPMGIAGDSLGNLWVANSGIVRPPCDGTLDTSLFDSVADIMDDDFSGQDASVTMISADGRASGPFNKGGLIVPWGIAVDGNDNVWVANFDGQRVSQMCGARAETCPPGHKTGDPISPDGGYSSDGLVRNTGVSIDPSGNVWLANNWETVPVQQNPGGHEIVVFIGLAKPVAAPLIGPPSGSGG